MADMPTLEADLAACTEPTVLAVRLVADGGLYLVERVKRGMYSLSRLARWVHEGDVVVAVKGWDGNQAVDTNIKISEGPNFEADASNWWHAAQIEEPPSDLGLGEELAGLQVDVIFEDPEIDTGSGDQSFVDILEYRSQSLAPASKSFGGTEASFTQVDSQATVFMDAMDVDPIADSQGLEARQSPEELLSGMRDHYLQALYVSKVLIMSLLSFFLVTNLYMLDVCGLFCQRTTHTLPQRISAHK